jgi:stress response protein SCP2
MAINLTKGQKVDLSKDNPGLKHLTVGLGWDAVQQSGGLFGLFGNKTVDVDCDASVFLLTDDKLADKKDIVYFGNLKHCSGAIRHCGDNLTGAGDGDDEQIVVDLPSIPAQYGKLVFVVNIFACVQRKQHFGMVKNAFIRIVDSDNNTELCRYNLTDDYSNKTALIFAEIYRHNGEWKFAAIGMGTNDPGLLELAKRYQ